MVIERAGIGPDGPTAEDITWIQEQAGIHTLDDVNASAFYGPAGGKSEFARVLAGLDLIDPTPTSGYDTTLLASLGIDPIEVQHDGLSAR